MEIWIFKFSSYICITENDTGRYQSAQFEEFITQLRK